MFSNTGTLDAGDPATTIDGGQAFDLLTEP